MTLLRDGDEVLQARVLAGAREEVLLGVEDPRARRRQRRVHLFCDGVGRLAVDRPQHQRLSMRSAQPRERAIEALHLLADDRDLLGALGAVLHLDFERLATSVPCGSVRAALHHVERDAQEEGRDLALTAEAGQGAEELEEGVLHQIVQVRLPSQPLGQKAPHPGELAPNDLIQLCFLDRHRHRARAESRRRAGLSC